MSSNKRIEETLSTLKYCLDDGKLMIIDQKVTDLIKKNKQKLIADHNISVKSKKDISEIRGNNDSSIYCRILEDLFEFGRNELKLETFLEHVQPGILNGDRFNVSSKLLTKSSIRGNAPTQRFVSTPAFSKYMDLVSSEDCETKRNNDSIDNMNCSKYNRSNNVNSYRVNGNGRYARNGGISGSRRYSTFDDEDFHKFNLLQSDSERNSQGEIAASASSGNIGNFVGLNNSSNENSFESNDSNNNFNNNNYASENVSVKKNSTSSGNIGRVGITILSNNNNIIIHKNTNGRNNRNNSKRRTKRSMTDLSDCEVYEFQPEQNRKFNKTNSNINNNITNNNTKNINIGNSNSISNKLTNNYNNVSSDNSSINSNNNYNRSPPNRNQTIGANFNSGNVPKSRSESIIPQINKISSSMIVPLSSTDLSSDSMVEEINTQITDERFIVSGSQKKINRIRQAIIAKLGLPPDTPFTRIVCL
ncbi:hypothetical protein TRFO_27539 [Tritrichomonas foetus]|uniref:Uncharacterized protein n=1 Tax=Tritrichomonas foetus TaxID=1144522 RepID=A0A1J4K1N1_9EUKA|nr:hypothetical protein TRFO_27539 [Tritrichomonas foetus]|eukprot:OHT04866.1 hypothetical protein TRFO_27539 [Tritrichomonas foetus]